MAEKTTEDHVGTVAATTAEEDMADGSMETEDTESGGTATWTQITPEPEKKAQATENPEAEGMPG